ncbi:MAG: ApbE family lipoprotein [Thermoleophilia bacterium]|nr:ApbE family lipoprotein [Thermoleophilia bacterium]
MSDPVGEDFERREFGVMGTFGELLLRADADVAAAAFDEVVAELERVSATLTRFDPSSPIERLNDAGEGHVDELMRDVLLAALQAYHDTGGRVDVGVGAAMVAAGYDRDFDLLAPPAPEQLDAWYASADGGRDGATEPVAGAAPLEPPFALGADGVVRVRAGSRIDLGGIAKGWAADRACAMLASVGTCLVNLGGDVAVHVASGDDPWPLGLELPGGIATYGLAAGGVATSGQDRRVWKSETSAGVAHHLIDPRSGQPAASDVLRISVFGATCEAAEVWSKALFLRGQVGAAEEAAALGIPAIIVGVDGSVDFIGLAPPA